MKSVKSWDLPKKYNKIAFDVDGVLCDFNTEFLYRVNEKFGLKLNANSMPTYNHVEELLGYKTANNFFEKEIKNGIFADCYPYPEAQIYLTNLLMDKKHDIHLITARGTEPGIYWTGPLIEQVHEDTLNWLTIYFPMFDHKKLIFARNKDEVIYKKGIELFVEDKLETADKLSTVCKSLLLSRSWNTGATKATRISSIAECCFYV